MRIIAKPTRDEYPEYAEMYMKLMPDDGLVLNHLADGVRRVMRLITGLPAEKLSYRYAEGKWTIKEILVHIVDDERIYAYRALSFARGEEQPLPGFDQDLYMRNSGAKDRALDSIFAEYKAVRTATIALFEGLPEDALRRMGTGSATFHPASVRALAYHIAGHERHHVAIIEDRYL